MGRRILNEALSKIVNAERRGFATTNLQPVSNVMASFLNIMKDRGYIKGFQMYEPHRVRSITVELSGRINDCRAIMHRQDIKAGEIEEYRLHTLPTHQWGYVVVTTPNGIMDHEEAIRQSVGGQDTTLERNALRRCSRERNSESEKWVCVVAEVKEEGEVTSCSYRDYGSYRSPEDRTVGLKLDYQMIMDAWSDKGPLCIDGGDCSQIVPDILDDIVLGDVGSMGMEVPQLRVQRDDDGEFGVRMTKEERVARVLRYKEKRRNRLFAKKIRYEVRKLNAEKRPRMKGRFVKRD
ncbi:hypothetical protein GIB67_004483 [Kingdonia uniflora]|uniref:CCT domain-containing protein n=1 Tax=Kingdonia uniflora TaxID=39325 RepID=A0A7J7MRK3_9MAGN|nr:hypothetical protein GIB67_004483 [Kingdonia uniflora]